MVFLSSLGEVRALYRAFKQECPNGIVDEETFKEVYEKIFPLGDASRYAHLVFCAIDRYVFSNFLTSKQRILKMYKKDTVPREKCCKSFFFLIFFFLGREQTGGITFGDFMEFLSVISKGSAQDKLLWAFTFYDLDKDGVISREEMLKVSDAIHELMGDGASSANGYEHVKIHVNKVFDMMDANSDGKVTMEEFVHYCNSHQEVRESINFLP